MTWLTVKKGLFTGLAWGLPLALIVTAAGARDGASGVDSKQKHEPDATQTIVKKKPRLRFRSGPPCVCETDVNEAAIRDAEVKRQMEQ